MKNVLQVFSRFRDPYSRTLAFLKDSDKWNEAQVRSWQLRELNKLIRHAKQHCPGYQRKLQAARWKGGLHRLEDLTELPFFTKDELRNHPDHFVGGNLRPESLKAVTSGGTTGEPTRFMVDAASYDSTFDAWRHAMWARAGYMPGMPSLDITWAFSEGAPIRGVEPNHVYLSIHALEAGQSGAWLQRVRDLRPLFVIGFPSTAVALANLLPTPGELSTVRALLLASEILTAHQRAVLTRAFPGVRIFQWYGMSELAGFASACEHSDAFHHWPQSGMLELIGDDDTPVQSPGKSGEIVLTGFANHATPFIRYRTGDRATLGNPCQACLRPNVVLESIEGRIGDYLLAEHGRVVPLSGLNVHTNEFQRIFSYQFVQDHPGSVVLRIAPMTDFTSADLGRIEKLMADKLGPDMLLTIESVSSIPRTARGKQPLIIRR